MSGRVDQAEMRRANMSLMLRSLRSGDPRSRARLATETGLSKGTTSTLIADLVGLGLVREDERERTGAVGRPGTAIAIDGGRVFGVGMEINVDYLALTVVDLRGRTVHSAVAALDIASTPVAEVLDQLARLIEDAMRLARARGGQIVGIGIGAPGIVDLESGSVRFAPNLGWHGVAVARELAARLGPAGPPIRLENDSKLGAVAEFSVRENQDIEDLLYLSADVGVGAGIVAGGRLMRGWSGFSGEVGHLPIGPKGVACPCGRTGCWELNVGLNAFLALAADQGDVVHDRSVPLEERLRALRGRADSGDGRVLAALSTIAANLSIGLSVLVDVLNPRMIVLGGYFPSFSDFLIAPITAALEARRMDLGSSAILVGSKLGLTSAARGGAQLVLEDVFEDPTIAASK
ncbi:ROK family transcriptional regulator [Microterricola viridarii]|uniref:Sugar kinase of the NBD/HSP70 family, may contain an N-terminal HTH domain n=1 Tax=Microterricola viridarii TaxID=412690 RepID=A0A1H1RC78_9MICO|nr:ROK family transcriptional regulator [Microterricola viridarii]SDS33275.1 Sugar kinase of the NBD/HSP70 family, may contain an N-terminal HTH domain [Microterricola viridarii]